MKSRDAFLTFNRGEVSALALGRIDVERVTASAETMRNWMPRRLGSMMLRPGLLYRSEALDNGKLIRFAAALDDTAIVEMTPGFMRVHLAGDTLLTRPGVSATITNPGFDSDLSGWTIADDAGATTDHLPAGLARLTGDGTASARLRRQVSVGSGQQGTVHSLRIQVRRGPVFLRIGSAAGEDDIFRQAVLRPGAHSIAFTPGASSFWIEFSNYLKYSVWVDLCQVEDAGPVVFETRWDTLDKVQKIRDQQVGRQILLASGERPYRIERRSNDSWSLVEFPFEDGPFLSENTTNTTLTASAIDGLVTLTASRPVFLPEHGQTTLPNTDTLFSMTSQGQLIQASASAENVFTDPIRITGVGTGRAFSLRVFGTFTGTVTLQRSLTEPGSWVDVESYTGDTADSFDDNLDNVVAFYRLGFKTAEFTSGTAELEMSFSGGAITGIVRVEEVLSSTQATGLVVKTLGGTAATEVWAEGAWSDVSGWPEAVAIYEGRSWWSGGGNIWASVSDAFSSFDPNFEGDGGPIKRTVGEGSGQVTNWLLPLQRLVIGTDMAEHSVRSTSFDEPVTPANYNSKDFSNKGSAAVQPVKTDGRGYFVARDGKSVYEIGSDDTGYNLSSLDVTTLLPEAAGIGTFEKMGAQVHPDTRIHVVRSGGRASVLVRDPAEDVMGWVEVQTPGLIRDVCVLPGQSEDRVFYLVRREIEGVNRFFIEEWAREDQCQGGSLNLQMDCAVVGGYSESGVLSGLDHLEGRAVLGWADGEAIDEQVVTGGQITIDGPVEEWAVGLPYEADYRSMKLGGATQMGAHLTQRKRTVRVGLVLRNTHHKGLKVGADADRLNVISQVVNGKKVDDGTVFEHVETEPVVFDDKWGRDNRLHMEARSPFPVTVIGAVLTVNREDES